MSDQILNLLASRFCQPAWALLWEVADAAGFKGKRRADAVAVSLWPSRGLELHGFEIKSNRSDWVRERDDPEKSVAIQQYMHRWWLVVTDEKIVFDGELPPTWGLLVRRGRTLVAKVEAPLLDPKPITYTFLAALLRRGGMDGAVPREVHDAAIIAAVKEATNRADARGHRDCQQVEKELRAQLAAVAEFEKVYGESLHLAANYLNHHREAIAATLAVVKHGGLTGLNDRLQQIRNLAEGVVDVVRTATKSIKESE